MSSESKSQQRLFGWVHACQKGTAKNCPPNISKVASSISPKDAEDFARTKHDGLPERKKVKKKKKKGQLKTFKEFMTENSLGSNERNIAGILNMSPEEKEQIRSQAGGMVGALFKKMSVLIGRMENHLNVKNQQAGDNTNSFHDLAVKAAFLAFEQAASGGKSYSQSVINRNMQNNMKNNQKPAQQQPQPQPQQQPQQQPAVGQTSGGPTPLHNLA